MFCFLTLLDELINSRKIFSMKLSASKILTDSGWPRNFQPVTGEQVGMSNPGSD